MLHVQADLLQDLDTRVVVPLLPSGLASKSARGLNPAFNVEGQPHLMLYRCRTRQRAADTRALLERADNDIMRAFAMLPGRF